MNNIEILEEFLKEYKDKGYFGIIKAEQIQIIYNLIQENKDLKEDLDYISKEKWKADEAVLFLTERIEEYQKQLDLDYVKENYITKSKVKEKIDKIQELQINYVDGITFDHIILELEELLEGE